MARDRIETIKALLDQTQAAHGAFEKNELNGVYDQEWAHWYAAYAVDHGADALLGRAITTDELAGLLASSYLEFQQAEPAPREPWSGYTARRIAEEL